MAQITGSLSSHKRRHRGQCRLRNEFEFYFRISRYSKIIYFVSVRTFSKLNLGHSDKREKEKLQNCIRSFYVLVCQERQKKCTKNYNARAQPLFSSLNLLFISDVAVHFFQIYVLRMLHLFENFFQFPQGAQVEEEAVRIFVEFQRVESAIKGKYISQKFFFFCKSIGQWRLETRGKCLASFRGLCRESRRYFTPWSTTNDNDFIHSCTSLSIYIYINIVKN